MGKSSNVSPLMKKDAGNLRKSVNFDTLIEIKAMESVNIGIHGVQNALKKEGKHVMTKKKHMVNQELRSR